MFDRLQRMLSTAALFDLLGFETRQRERNLRSRRVLAAGLLLSGIAVGALGALLLAPRSGRKLRADVMSRGRVLASRDRAGRRESPGALENNTDPTGGSPEGATGI